MFAIERAMQRMQMGSEFGIYDPVAREIGDAVGADRVRQIVERSLPEIERTVTPVAACTHPA